MTEIRLIDHLPEAQLEELRRLYISAGWLKEDEAWAFLPEMLKRTEAAVGAFDGESLVGFGRALSDGCSDAYIQDVVVALSCRKQGIGGRIIRALETVLRERGVDWIALVGEPGTGTFYQKLGLEIQPGYVFWKFPER